MKVYVSRGELEKALRRLKKRLQAAGFDRDIKRQQGYRKPSELRRDVARKAMKRAQKARRHAA